MSSIEAIYSNLFYLAIQQYCQWIQSCNMNLENGTENVKIIAKCHINSDAYSLVFRFPSSLVYVIHFTACILSVVITLATVGLNSLTLLTFWRTPRLRKNVLLFLVMVLSFVDTGTGVICHPTLTISLIYDLMNTPQCWIIDIKAKLFRITSVLSLSVVSAISIERYFGVVHPIVHRTTITRGKLFQLLLYVWSMCALVLVLSFLTSGNPVQYFGTICCALLILITVYCYTRIAFVVVLSRRSRHGLTTERKDKLHFLRELKMAKSSFLIALCYLICYIPSLIILGVMRESLSISTKFFASPWCLMFLMLNCVLNSVVFFWRSTSLRKETKNVLRNLRMKHWKMLIEK